MITVLDYQTIATYGRKAFKFIVRTISIQKNAIDVLESK